MTAIIIIIKKKVVKIAEQENLAIIGSDVDGGGNTHAVPNKCFGTYRAKVVDVEDELKAGRVKVHIATLNHLFVKETDGIWARPAPPFGGSNLEEEGAKISDFGSLYVPPKNTFVRVFFEDGDPSKPYYTGGFVSDKAIPTECRVGKQYWNKHMVIKTPEKRMIFVSDDTDSDASVIIRGRDRNI